MDRKPNAENVVQFKPSAGELNSTIRRLSEDSSNVSWSRHALSRMAERGISTLDALRVLRTGDIDGEIEPGNDQGEWKVKVVARIKGNRDVGVVTVVIQGQRIFVKTAEWEDLK